MSSILGCGWSTMASPSQTEPALTHCRFEHPVFQKLDRVVFRPGEGDGQPVQATSLDDQVAALPLSRVQREFGIADSSPDGRTLALIARALQFVHELRLGDALPSEVLGGDASWQPEAVHLRYAASRLKLQLASWVSQGTEDRIAGVGHDVVLAMVEDPAMRQQVQLAFAQAAQSLGLDNTEAVVALVEEAARELAYIEALRARLLQRVQALAGRLAALASGAGLGSSRLEVLIRVRRLMQLALGGLRERFDQLDAQTGEVMGLLRNREGQRAFIRGHRDWLYCSLRGWDPILTAWEEGGEASGEATWQRVMQTYRFLAPRYMPVQEWRVLDAARTTPTPTRAQMVW